MHWIDTHTHLYVDAFDEDQEAIIGRALAAGVQQFCLPSIDLSFWPKMLALKKAYPEQMHLMMGLHPTHVKQDYKLQLDEIEALFKKHSFVAVGEIGVDLYWDKTFLKQQQEAVSN